LPPLPITIPLTTEVYVILPAQTVYRWFIILFFVPQIIFAQKLPSRRSGLPFAIREVSGMARTPDGQLWLLNDSRKSLRNCSALILTPAICLKPVTCPFPNRDWEDITSDSSGNLYIGDFGNNGNARRTSASSAITRPPAH
jgi:hypothetical protein